MRHLKLTELELREVQSRAVHLYSYETCSVAEAWLAAFNEVLAAAEIVIDLESKRHYNGPVEE